MYDHDDYAALLAPQPDRELRKELIRRGYTHDEVSVMPHDRMVGVLAIFGHDDDIDARG
jgi:hypothetical protein